MELWWCAHASGRINDTYGYATYYSEIQHGGGCSEYTALFGSICRLSDDSVEKQIGRRQFSIKSYSSHSWFVVIKELLIKYDLNSPFFLMDAKLRNRNGEIELLKRLTHTGLGD